MSVHINSAIKIPGQLIKFKRLGENLRIRIENGKI